MKLKLEGLRDISILQVMGQITPDNFPVLKAGIKKLFSTGKNKIILELPDSSTFPTPVLRDLAVLNLLASELSGEILLAEIAPLTRAKIEAFSKPPVVKCFTDRSKASEYFYPKVSDELSKKSLAASSAVASAIAPDLVSAPVTLPPTGSHTTAPAPLTEAQQTQIKKEIRAKELGGIGDIRKNLHELEVENRELKTRLAELMILRRDPPDLESWREKTAKLEKDLASAIKMAQDAMAAKK